MKRILMVALLATVAGCAPAPDQNGTPVESGTSAYTARTYDATYGVVCYRYTGTSGGPSCVKVN